MIKNLFWTGGFDSTFRLLQLVDNKNIKDINLFYISNKIDSRQEVEILHVQRESQEFELSTMSRILSVIDTSKIKKFTIWGTNDTLLYCSMIFDFQFMNYIQRDSIEYSDKVKVNQFDLWYNLITSRPVMQYGAISQILEELDIEAEICLEKGGGIWSNTVKYFESMDGDKVIFRPFQGQKAFERYLMPLYDTDRQQMIKISIENEWVDILYNTWSCWYPVDRKPCGVCDMCSHREGLFDY